MDVFFAAVGSVISTAHLRIVEDAFVFMCQESLMPENSQEAAVRHLFLSYLVRGKTACNL